MNSISDTVISNFLVLQWNLYFSLESFIFCFNDLSWSFNQNHPVRQKWVFWILLCLTSPPPPPFLFYFIFFSEGFRVFLLKRNMHQYFRLSSGPFFVVVVLNGDIFISMIHDSFSNEPWTFPYCHHFYFLNLPCSVNSFICRIIGL